jgi:hypothetical protein
MAMRTHRNLLGAEGQLLLACPVAAQNAVQNHVLQTPFNSPNARIGFRGQQLLPAKTTISRQWLGRSSAFGKLGHFSPFSCGLHEITPVLGSIFDG